MMNKNNIFKKATVLITAMAFWGCFNDHLQAQEMAIDSVDLPAMKGDSIIAEKLILSGYVQFQEQFGERYAVLNVGSPNLGDENRFNRFGIRRGRIKLTYQKDFIQSALQLDFTEKGISLKDAFLALKMPPESAFLWTFGLFNIPFGNEVGESSANRPSPERSLISQTLFPDEWDLGTMVTIQAKPKSPWHLIKFQFGVLSGSGLNINRNGLKDLVGRLSFSQKFTSGWEINGGGSFYRGNLFKDTDSVFRMKDSGFRLSKESKDARPYLKRFYGGLDISVKFHSKLGLSQLQSEWVWGQQPATKKSSKTLVGSQTSGASFYVRNFQGGYISWLQQVGQTAFSLIFKYEFYQPNREVRGDQIGKSNTSVGDISYQILGMGLLWDMDKIRLTCYSDWVYNERSLNLDTFQRNRPANKLTLRLQFKF